MKGLLKSAAAFSVLAALGATSAHAQLSIGAGAGIVIPLGDYGDAVKTGWDATGIFQWKPATSPVGLQIDGTYQQNSFDPSGGKEQWLYGTGNLVYWLPVAKETKIRPYLLGGGGVYNFKAKVTGATTNPSTTKFGFNAGAGFDFGFGNSGAFFVEGRFHNVFVDGPDAKFIPINAGFRFRTGK